MSEAQRATRGPQPGWRRFARALLNLLALCAMLPSIGSLAARWWWAADLCCHFRVQYAIALLPLVLIYAWLRAWKWFAVVGCVLGVNLILIAPLFLPASSTGTKGTPLKLTTANVYVGNRQSSPFLDLLAKQDPDIVLVLEINDWWMTELEALRDKYPHRIDSISDPEHPSYGAFGCVLMSRMPLHDARIVRVGPRQLPAVLAEIEHEGRTITVCGAHPLPPAGRAPTAARDQYLTELGELLVDIDTPLILLGDLNTTRWSPVFDRLTSAASVRDASEGFGFQPTWPDWLPLPVIPIDHILVSTEFSVVDHTVGASIASDHRPVTTTVVLSSTADSSPPK